MSYSSNVNCIGVLDAHEKIEDDRKLLPKLRWAASSRNSLMESREGIEYILVDFDGQREPEASVPSSFPWNSFSY